MTEKRKMLLEMLFLRLDKIDVGIHMVERTLNEWDRQDEKSMSELKSIDRQLINNIDKLKKQIQTYQKPKPRKI